MILRKVKFWLIIFIILIAIGYWGWHGFYSVPPNAYGVESVMGNLVKITKNGKHWMVPPPIGSLTIIPALINLETPGDWYIVTKEGVPLKSKIKFRCRIIDPWQFYKTTKGDIENLLRNIENLILKESTYLPLKELIKNRNPTQIETAMQNISKTYGCQIDIYKFNIKIPSPVTEAVNRLEEAERENEDKIERTLTYANLTTQEAKVYAEKITKEAFIQLYKTKRELNVIQNQYNALSNLYAKDPKKVEELLNLQIIQNLMEHSGKIIIAPPNTGVNR